VTGTTPSGDYEAPDGQNWTYQGSLHYQSWDTSGGTELYDWGYEKSAKLNLNPENHYEDALVRYRAVLYYDVNTIIWESCEQDSLDTTFLFGDSRDQKEWDPDPSGWEGSLSIPVVHKVQTSHSDDLGDLEAKSFTLQHNQ